MTTSKLSTFIGIRSILKGSSLGIIVDDLLALICIMPFLSTGMTNYRYWLLIASSECISNISINFSWGGSISPEGFQSSVMLWLVIIVAVVGVGVTVVVVIIVA
ncbi:hypothetical protein Tco_0219943, partial [Tanacetum coccineum]